MEKFNGRTGTETILAPERNGNRKFQQNIPAPLSALSPRTISTALQRSECDTAAALRTMSMYVDRGDSGVLAREQPFVDVRLVGIVAVARAVPAATVAVPAVAGVLRRSDAVHAASADRVEPSHILGEAEIGWGRV